MDRLESMATLIAAVEAGSFSAAARALRVPLATVSRRVAELEEHLRVRLVTRSSRKLSLTQAGREYFGACKCILDAIGDAERVARGEYGAPKGELTVSAPFGLGRAHLLPLVHEFLGVYPDIDVRLMLGDRVLNLVEEHVDVALRVGELPDSSLFSTRLGSIERVTCASPGYLEAHGAPQRPEDLIAHACVMFESVSPRERWLFAAPGGVNSVALRSRLTVNTAEAAVDAAVAGVGVTHVYSYQMAEAERAGRLVRLLRAYEIPGLPVSLVHGTPAPHPLKLRAFLDFVGPRLKTRLAGVGLEAP